MRSVVIPCARGKPNNPKTSSNTSRSRVLSSALHPNKNSVNPELHLPSHWPFETQLENSLGRPKNAPTSPRMLPSRRIFSNESGQLVQPRPLRSRGIRPKRLCTRSGRIRAPGSGDGRLVRPRRGYITWNQPGPFCTRVFVCTSEVVQDVFLQVGQASVRSSMEW